MLELQSSAPDFRPGDQIVHSIMGAGVILDIDTDKHAYLIKFDGIETPRKVSMKAKIEGA
jgi:DNA helicase-2/ATP-dependent DNA helicase PcrA